MSRQFTAGRSCDGPTDERLGDRPPGRRALYCDWAKRIRVEARYDETRRPSEAAVWAAARLERKYVRNWPIGRKATPENPTKERSKRLLVEPQCGSYVDGVSRG